ncbi:bifunctional phosphopantothenoylcysteine decarboxylase/phosphopantothenate--cysteine ligase CoaBC [Bacillus alkalicellulosilyticus]|uniref:bifunctional phosphopantothenoylcysteine decarboxylase/phosphopantothenate--cysteine ligase CoaBC n=1 Tax=Alkalihalobacterium alkalicellulosilyticum TaxID=1912214 RepID=UPI0009980E3A|nr:bifunctional phosphopantothenoylcysteine decarboxylase/phosphopantothenate--cysteine ligase CoaBC [Bacillus alkalicellulosilyticus]
MISGKKILLCVSGGIAVYKAAALTSKLVQAGAVVKVLMSQSAKQFVTPLTFQTLSRNEVHDDTFAENNPKVVAHIDLADWADIVVIAPATANIIGKIANGIADDMITTTLLATVAPVVVAPAMNVHMYEHPAVQKNMKTLQTFGYTFIEPDEGFLACGYVGKGRLAEPEDIVQQLSEFVKSRESKPLLHKKIIVTAGPTQEKLDPVRFFTNHSSGKMGFAIAEVAARLGADVTLVAGPTSLSASPTIRRVNVTTAEDMYHAVIDEFATSDIIIKSAAVADYRPKQSDDKKMKKQTGPLILEFERTKDILQELGQRKQPNQLLVGFAAETNDVEAYAIEKLERKNLDVIIANDITAPGAGFQVDTNRVTIMTKDKEKIVLPQLSKTEVAEEIMKVIIDLMAGDNK